LQDEQLVADGFRGEPGLEFLADVAVDQLGVLLEIGEGVLAERGEQVPVEGLPVAIEGRLFFRPRPRRCSVCQRSAKAARVRGSGLR
jgi:hypothetical protein